MHKMPEMLERVTQALDALLDDWVAGRIHTPDLSRAAIQAMREPTMAMTKAAWVEDADDVWRNMIDAALASPEDPEAVGKESLRTAPVASPKEGGVSDPRDERIAKLEAELAGWKRVAVEAVIPLEAMRMAGADKLHSDAIQQGIAHAITIVRRAVTGEGLPPEPPATPDPAS